MSIRLMNAVWDLPLPDSQKLVLLSLADQASDSGICWPSVAHIAKRCSKGEKTIFRTLDALAKGGHITRETRPGRGTVYTIHPCHDDTPVTMTPLSPRHPTPVTMTVNPCHDDIQNTKNHQGTTKGNKGAGKTAIAKPDDVSDETWRDFLDLRKQKRAPLTATALKGIEREAGKAGWTLEAALTECCQRGWQGFKAEWTKGRSNGNRHHNNDGQQLADPFARAAASRQAERSAHQR